MATSCMALINIRPVSGGSVIMLEITGCANSPKSDIGDVL